MKVFIVFFLYKEMQNMQKRSVVSADGLSYTICFKSCKTTNPHQEQVVFFVCFAFFAETCKNTPWYECGLAVLHDFKNIV